jgi:hypothetical protein
VEQTRGADSAAALRSLRLMRLGAVAVCGVVMTTGLVLGTVGLLNYRSSVAFARHAVAATAVVEQVDGAHGKAWVRYPVGGEPLRAWISISLGGCGGPNQRACPVRVGEQVAIAYDARRPTRAGRSGDVTHPARNVAPVLLASLGFVVISGLILVVYLRMTRPPKVLRLDLPAPPDGSLLRASDTPAPGTRPRTSPLVRNLFLAALGAGVVLLWLLRSPLARGMVLLGLLGLGFTLVSAAQLAWLRGEARGRVRTQGTVVALEPTPSDVPFNRQMTTAVARSETVTYHPVIRFTAGDGRAVELHSDFGGTPRSYQVGEQVPVLYDPADPTKARLDTPLATGLVPVIFLVIGLLLIAAAVVVAVVAAR